MQGYIKLHREIMEHDLWRDERFSKGQAWVDLILMANHKDRKVIINNQFELVKRGSFITSIRKLADRWGWHHHTVETFLNLLESDNMIVRNSTRISTHIAIVNYEKYQGVSDFDNEDISTPISTQNSTPISTVNSTPISTPISTQNAHQLATNNNEKNVKNDKNDKNEKNEKKIILTDTKVSVSQTEVRQVLEEWNTLERFGIKSVSKITSTSKRYQMLVARLKEYSLEDVFSAIENIRGSSFLQGKNNRGWSIDFDWFVKPNNFPKVLEGNYNKTRQETNSSSVWDEWKDL